MRWSMLITGAEVIGKMRRTLGAIVALAAIALPLVACSQFEQRDKRFYYRALWNFALRENLKELDIEFNGVDFGHSNLYEHLLLTEAKMFPLLRTPHASKRSTSLRHGQFSIPMRKRLRPTT